MNMTHTIGIEDESRIILDADCRIVFAYSCTSIRLLSLRPKHTNRHLLNRLPNTKMRKCPMRDMSYADSTHSHPFAISLRRTVVIYSDRNGSIASVTILFMKSVPMIVLHEGYVLVASRRINI